ncbi:MAG: hypothetical protein MMC33_009556 [Icmadophila ericetorum]|nr:hypothetical protein [Icmadophila ericetorum]
MSQVETEQTEVTTASAATSNIFEIDHDQQGSVHQLIDTEQSTTLLTIENIAQRDVESTTQLGEGQEEQENGIYGDPGRLALQIEHLRVIFMSLEVDVPDDLLCSIAIEIYHENTMTTPLEWILTGLDWGAIQVEEVGGDTRYLYPTDLDDEDLNI